MCIIPIGIVECPPPLKEMYIKLTFLIIIFTALLISGCTDRKGNVESKYLEGEWIVVEKIIEFSDSTRILKNPPPSLWIFSNKYYSATQITIEGNREVFYDASNPTPEEIIKAYKSFSTNTGRYELTDTTLITYPIIAKVPAYSGGKGIYEFKFKSDTLYLTMIEEYYSNGKKTTWLDNRKITLKLIKTDK